MKILLVGAGNLGRRYLEGINRLEDRVELSIVDPSDECLKLAQQIFIETKRNVSTFSNIDEVKQHEFDVCIVTTNSDVRYEVVDNLLSKFNINKILLEKVLFQRLADYESTQNAFLTKDIKAWVNHPRRYFPVYQELAKILSDKDKVTIEVSGGNWGLCSNTIHFLDLFEYLTNSKITKISTQDLENRLIDAKRKGFFEMSGTIKANSEKGELIVTDNPSLTSLLIKISGEGFTINIDEAKHQIEYSESLGLGHFEKISYYQSELTDQTVLDMVGGTCKLPTYSEASDLHQKYISALLLHINKFSETELVACPIT